jgi:hypothetical protein
MTTVWIYVDTKYHVGHPDHLKVFANPVAADEWFKENDPEGAHSNMRSWSEPGTPHDFGRPPSGGLFVWRFRI